MTLIFWMPDVLKGNRMYLADYNIVYQMIQFFREPILGNPLTNYTITYLSIFTLVAVILSIIIYKKYHKGVVFWI